VPDGIDHKPLVSMPPPKNSICSHCELDLWPFDLWM